MLTRAQKRAFKAIKRFIDDHGEAPSLSELAHELGIQSKGVVHRYVKALAEQGFIKITPKKHHGISILRDLSSPADTGLPLLGKIAAGHPIEAINDPQRINFNNLLEDEQLYLLRVRGDSMIEEGIFDDDLVICRHANTANNGDIVVALIDDQEATLKRLEYHPNETVTLHPANHRLSPLTIDQHRLRIQGVFVGLLRIPSL